MCAQCKHDEVEDATVPIPTCEQVDAALDSVLGSSTAVDACLLRRVARLWLAREYPIRPMPGQDDHNVIEGPAYTLAAGLRELGLSTAVRECAEDEFDTEFAVVPDNDDKYLSVHAPWGDAISMETVHVDAALHAVAVAVADFTQAERKITVDNPGPGAEAAFNAFLAAEWES